MYNKLEGKIVEKVRTKEAFAKAMELSHTTITKKLNGKIDWKRNEMRKACEVLDIPINEMIDYFF